MTAGRNSWALGVVWVAASALCGQTLTSQAGVTPPPQQATPAQPDPNAMARAFALAKAKQDAQQPAAKPDTAAKPAATPVSGSKRRKGKPEPQTALAQTPVAVPRTPTRADEPAKPADVAYADGRLTVKADNADLAEILRTTAERTGMTIDGNPPSGRVFGEFGPGPASTVIAKLLDGTNMNYAVLSRPDGQPQKLVLSAAKAAVPGEVQAQPQQPGADSDDDDDEPPKPAPFRPVPTLNNQNRQQGPGAGIRTPQQILQDMQQRRAQQGDSQPE